MTNDLLLALLSMDAYHQGFGAAIPDVGTNIGGASVIAANSLSLSPELQAALATDGFAATAYSMTGTGTNLDGAIVISYRGSEDANDYLNDFQLTVGELAGQTLLAAKYYFAVKRQASHRQDRPDRPFPWRRSRQELSPVFMVSKRQFSTMSRLKLRRV